MTLRARLALLVPLLVGASLLAAPPAAHAEEVFPATAVTVVSAPDSSGVVTSTDVANGSVVPHAAFRGIHFVDRVVVRPGLTVALYDEPNLQGHCFTATRDHDETAAIEIDLDTTVVAGVVRSLVVGEGCRGADPNGAGGALTLCRDAGCPGGGSQVTIRRDLRDLRDAGINDWASAVQVGGDLYAVALYSEVGYGGRCSTLLPGYSTLADAGDTVGNDTVSSVRLDATCAGPLAAPPVIGDLAVVSGDSAGVSCANGYTKLETDLNATMGGRFVYACQKLVPLTVGTTYVDDVAVLRSFSAATSDDDCDDGYRLLRTDLNEEAGGNYVYLCIRPRTSPYGSTPSDVGVVRRLWFSMASDGSYIPDELCDGTADATMGFDVPESEVSAEGNANDMIPGLPTEVLVGDVRAIGICEWRPTMREKVESGRLLLPHDLTLVGTTTAFQASGIGGSGDPLAVSCDGFANGGPGSEFFVRYDAAPGTRTVECSAVDHTGATVTGSFQVTHVSADVTRPLALLTATRADGTSYPRDTWTHQAVTVDWYCADLGAGASGVHEDTLVTETVTGPAIRGVTSSGTCADNAGNLAQSGSFGPIKIDTAAPAIDVVSPAAGTVVGLGDDLALDATCTDPFQQAGQSSIRSGLASCLPTSGTALDTSSPGEHSLEVVALDHAGNSTTRTVTWEVANAAPTLVAPATAAVQYSDAIEVPLSASDPEGHDVAFTATGLPSGLRLEDHGDGTAAVLGRATGPAGERRVTVTVTDAFGAATASVLMVAVTREDATVTVLGPARRTVKPDARDRAPRVTVRVRVADAADGARGDVARAVPVQIRLVPRGQGRTLSCTDRALGSGTSTVAQCSVQRVPLGRYRVVAVVAGGSYRGSDRADLTIVRR